MKIGELAGRRRPRSRPSATTNAKACCRRRRAAKATTASTGPAHVERLAFVRHCRSLDMTLDEIRSLLRFKDAPQADCGEVNALLDAHIGHVATASASCASSRSNSRRCATSAPAFAGRHRAASWNPGHAAGTQGRSSSRDPSSSARSDRPSSDSTMAGTSSRPSRCTRSSRRARRAAPRCRRRPPPHRARPCRPAPPAHRRRGAAG
jgi:hypothetical protein